MKKLFRLLPLLLALLVFCACTANPKDFEAAGLTITLTDDFAREDSLNEGQDAVFVSDDAGHQQFPPTFCAVRVISIFEANCVRWPDGATSALFMVTSTF